MSFHINLFLANLMFEMMATGSNCVQMSYDAKQARAFGYVAKLLDDGSFECSFFTKDMGLDFNLSPTDSLVLYSQKLIKSR